MVQAGKATDAVIDSLIPLLDHGDIIIDGGNAKWTDTIEREKKLNQENLLFVGSGVSGGEEGARFGPSLCLDVIDANAIKDIWLSISAKVDPENGKPIEGQLRKSCYRRSSLCFLYWLGRCRSLCKNGSQRY